MSMWMSAVRQLLTQAEPLTIPRPQETIVQMVTGSGAVVQAVLFLLLGFSGVSWAVIFTKRRQIRRAGVESERFIAIFWHPRNLPAINTASLDPKETPAAQPIRARSEEAVRRTRPKRR